jgi:seryl-tRNA(Sec) selenium transferase
MTAAMKRLRNVPGKTRRIAKIYKEAGVKIKTVQQRSSKTLKQFQERIE